MSVYLGTVGYHFYRVSWLMGEGRIGDSRQLGGGNIAIFSIYIMHFLRFRYTDIDVSLFHPLDMSVVHHVRAKAINE